METSVLLTATKEFKWDMAHMLAGHEGLCKNLHGHTYKMEVSVARTDTATIEAGPSEGMVMDFKSLKEVVNDLIVKPYDHAVVLNQNTTDEFESDLIQLVVKHKKKAVLLTYRPTAENMARKFFKDIQDELHKRGVNIAVVSLKLYETPTSYATVSV